MTIGNLWQYYAALATRISDRDNNPANLPDAKIWEAKRGQLHQQFMISLGLGTLPAKCDLAPQVTGSFHGEGYTAEKISYQLLPNVWGSAHLYRPANAQKNTKLPGVLYTCGHRPCGVIGYQYHAIAWAQRGYICLIIDTIEQHDNPGDHHGLHSGRTPEWIGMGYTGAGGEIYNGMRAMDLLLSQSDVDPARIGVTGLSGGGSQSFRLAIADPRIKACASVAGVSDPAFAIAAKHVRNHCDCMYEHNRFAHDITFWGALIAPRPLLLGNARHDQLYTPQEYHTIFGHIQKRYEKLGAKTLPVMVEYDGQHGYNFKSTCDAIHDFFDKHVSGQSHPEVDTLGIRDNGPLNDEPTLTVHNGQPPSPNYTALLPTLLSVEGYLPLPMSEAELNQTRRETVARLNSEIFFNLDDVQEPQTLTQTGNWTNDGIDRLVWDGKLDHMTQSVAYLHSEPKDDPAVLICIGDRPEDGLYLAERLRSTARATGHKISVMGIEARATGREAPHPDHRTILNREGCLVGLTPTAMLVQDLHHLMPKLLELPEIKNKPVYLYGKDEGALAMLYYALLNMDSPLLANRLKGVMLQGLPSTHLQGENQILGINNILQLDQAKGLLAPVPLMLISSGGVSNRQWAKRAYDRLGAGDKLTTAGSLSEAIRTMMAE